MTTTTYRNWERFWQMHLTPEYREAMHSDNRDECGSLESIDVLRGFFSALAGKDGDAEMPPSLCNVYCHLATHLSVVHDLPELDENNVTEEQFSDLNPVFDALYDAMPKGFVVMVASALTADISEN